MRRLNWSISVWAVTLTLLGSLFYVSLADAAELTRGQKVGIVGDSVYVNLAQPIPTFAPSEGNSAGVQSGTISGQNLFTIGKHDNFPLPDSSFPILDSTGTSTPDNAEFLQPPVGQTVQGFLEIFTFPTSPEAGEDPMSSFFARTIFSGAANIGTTIDAPAHFNIEDPEPFASFYGSPQEFRDTDRRTITELPMNEQVGKLILIDISKRVQAELDRVGGDLSQVNFANDSGNNVEIADINSIADHLENGAWVIIRTTWDRFFHNTAQYGNGFNYPGITPAAVNRLIELENQQGIHINGVGADTRTADTGQSVTYPPPQNYPLHFRGLNRGWKLLENLANLDLLPRAASSIKATLILGITPFWGAAESYVTPIAMLEDVEVICHNGKTELALDNLSRLASHLDHGDTLGKCNDD